MFNVKDYKPYTPAFKESKKVITIKEAFAAIKAAKSKLRKIKEADEENRAEILDDVIDSVGDALETVISDLGPDDSAVSSLIDVARDLGIEQDLEEFEDEEEILAEAEETEKEETEKDKAEDEKEKADKENEKKD
jgi:hypothetical protein